MGYVFSQGRVSAHNADVLNYAAECAGLRKLPTDFRRMFSALASGEAVNAVDFDEGIMLALQCCTTAAGQSMARRQKAAHVRALWDHVHHGGVQVQRTNQGYDHISIPGLGAKAIAGEPVPPLSDPARVEAWLTR